jgi:hypothetical protein
MSKTPKRQSVVMPTVEEDRCINAAARADPDALPLTPKQFRFVTAQRLWRISKPLAKAGKAAWMVCCANTFKRMRCLKASDF